MSEPALLAIVEDDETFARTLRRSFERRGYEVMQAASHEELVEQLADRTPRYAVVDVVPALPPSSDSARLKFASCACVAAEAVPVD